MILELANHPITNEANAALVDRGVVIIPDILANAGGVVVSYFEWVQNQQGWYWSEEDVNAKLEQIMVAASEQVWETTQKLSTNLRVGAYALALERLLITVERRGMLN